MGRVRVDTPHDKGVLLPSKGHVTEDMVIRQVEITPVQNVICERRLSYLQNIDTVKKSLFLQPTYLRAIFVDSYSCLCIAWVPTADQSPVPCTVDVPPLWLMTLLPARCRMNLDLDSWQRRMTLRDASAFAPDPPFILVTSAMYTHTNFEVFVTEPSTPSLIWMICHTFRELFSTGALRGRLELRFGKGKCEWLKSKDTYDGEWISNRMHGFGTYIYGSERKKHMDPGKKYDPWDHVFEDDTYKGEWIKGKRSGRGVFTKSSGEQWDGEWKNGYRHGMGTIRYRTGKKRDGVWRHDALIVWNTPEYFSAPPSDAVGHRQKADVGKAVGSCVGHAQEICGLAWSPDGTTLASGGNDNDVMLWDAATTGARSQAPSKVFSEHCAAVKALAWCPHDRHVLATGGGTADRCIKLWNASRGGDALNSIDTGSQVCALAWSRSVDELVSTHGYSLNQICIWNVPSLTNYATLTGHCRRVLYLAISPDNQTIVTGAGDESLRFWACFGRRRSGPGGLLECGGIR